jgi:predicted porin
LNRTKTAGQRAFGREDSNLTGLIDGFPNWSAKFGLNYDFNAIPLTLRATYQNIHLEDTAQGTDSTADVTTYASDYDVKKWLTLTAEYDHTRQTSQTTTDEYIAQASLRF